MHATQHVCAAVAIELWDVVAPHGLVRPGALSDTAIAVVLVSTIPLRMICATLHRHLWPCRNNQRVAQQPHCPQRSPRLLRAFHELSEPAVHVAMLVALFERMLRCCINILIISYILHLYLQLIHVYIRKWLTSPRSFTLPVLPVPVPVAIYYIYTDIYNFLFYSFINYFYHRRVFSCE